MEGISKIWLGRILGKNNLFQGDKAEEFILDGIQFYDELGIKPFAAQVNMFPKSLLIIVKSWFHNA
ncbi:hypothetical protein ACFL2E_10890 [Thermodesulfobacteriota bacterium]